MSIPFSSWALIIALDGGKAERDRQQPGRLWLDLWAPCVGAADDAGQMVECRVS